MKKTIILIALIGWAVYSSHNPMFISLEFMLAICVLLSIAACWLDKKEEQSDK